MDPTTVTAFLGTWGYPALLFLLLVTAVGSPIPEDLILVTAGYLIYSDVLQWPFAVAISLLGVIGSDLMLYSAGRHIAWHSDIDLKRRFLSPTRLQTVTRWFTRFGGRVILIARLTPGTRALVFVSAGVQALPMWSFLRYDALGAALWVPAMVALGYSAGSRIGGLEEFVDWLHQGATWVVAFAGLLLVVWVMWGREESKL